MILSVSKEFKTNGETRVLDIPVLVGFSPTNKFSSDDEDAILVYSSLLVYDSNILKVFADRGFDIKITVVNGVDMPVPYITRSDANITNVYNFIEGILDSNNTSEFPEDMFTRVLSTIKDKFDHFGDSEFIARKLIKSCVSMYNYLKESSLINPITIGKYLYDNKYFKEVDQLINSLNDNIGNPFSSLKLSDNVTKYQNTCADEFFLEIPLDRSFVGETSINYLSRIPSMKSVVTPYTNPNAYSVDYDLPGKLTPLEIPLVEGVLYNSYSDLYPNELKYYNALCEWIKFKSEEKFGTELTDENVIITDDTLEYLNNLLENIYYWHWQHNPFVPIRAVSDEDDEDSDFDEGSVSDDMGGYQYNIGQNTDLSVTKNASTVLVEYVQVASMKIGYKAYAEAIVKLARWGSRKPRMIYLKGYNIMYDLQSVKLVPYLGNIEEYSILKSHGCDYSIAGVLYSDTKLQYKIGNLVGNQLKFPIGMILIQTMENKVDPERENVILQYYVPMLDVIRMLKDGTTINGLEYDKETDNIDVDIYIDLDTTNTYSLYKSIYINNMSSYFVDPFYRSKELNGLFLELGVDEVSADEFSSNHFSIVESKLLNPKIFDDINANSFTTKSQLKDKITSWKILNKTAAIELNVFNEYYKVYEYMVNNVNEDTNSLQSFDIIINEWNNAIKETGYTHEASFLRDSVLYQNTSINPLEAFNGNSNEEEYEADLIKQFDINGNDLCILKGPNGPIGYLQTTKSMINGKPLTQHILAAEGTFDKDKFRVGTSTVSSSNLLPMAFMTLSHIQNRSTEKIQLYFDNASSMSKIASAFTAK